MKPGQLVLTRSFEDRSEVRDKPSMRTSWKSKPGYAFVLLNLGTVDHEAKMVDQAHRVLNALGWTSPPDAVGQDEGIAVAFLKGGTA